MLTALTVKKHERRKDVYKRQPKDRDIAMVFQHYALYPHMTVYDNMAFGLKLRKTPKDEIKRLSLIHILSALKLRLKS